MVHVCLRVQFAQCHLLKPGLPHLNFVNPAQKPIGCIHFGCLLSRISLVILLVVLISRVALSHTLPR